MRQAAANLGREKFLPVTRHALLDRLTARALWPNGDHAQARRFLRYLDYWRRHSYAAKLLDLEQLYEPFSPDTDLLQTRSFSPQERQAMQKRLVAHMAELLTQGNFTRIAPEDFHVILTKDSHYGLDLQVDTDAFEELLIFYRGATTITERHRDIRKAYIGWKEVRVPVFQRLFILFKLKPYETRVQELMEQQKVDRKKAEAIVRRQRKMLPDTVTSDHVYIKLFKNMPRSDVEMAFPNTKVRFRPFDKIKLGVTASSGVRRRRGGHDRQARPPQQSLHAGDDAGRPRRHRRTPGQQLHRPAQPLHGGPGEEPLLPLHGRQPRAS